MNQRHDALHNPVSPGADYGGAWAAPRGCHG